MFNLYSIIFLLSRKDRLITIVMIGTILLTVITRMAYHQQLNADGSFNLNMLYWLLAGMMIDFTFFLFVILYKTWLLQKEITLQQLEQQLQLQRTRMMIGNDLHDDVGGTLSSVRLSIALAGKKCQQHQALQDDFFNKVGWQIQSVMENMNDIIWSVDTEKERSFANRLQDFYAEHEYAGYTKCDFEIDPILAEKIKIPSVRKNLLMIAKEGITNVFKHADASYISVRLFQEGDEAFLMIKDDGNGIPIDHKLGKGLKSMKTRAEMLGGNLLIDSSNNGTTIICKMFIKHIG